MFKIKTKNKKEMLIVLSRLSGANTLYKKNGIASFLANFSFARWKFFQNHAVRAC